MARPLTSVTRFAAFAGLTSLITVGLPDALSAQESQYTLRGSEVAIWNLVGSISVEGGTGSEVRVTVGRRGPDAGRLSVATGTIGRRETLRVIYPDTRIVFREERGSGFRSIGDSRTTLYVNDDGTFSDGYGARGERVEIRTSGSGLEAAADVRVQVPRGMRVALYLAAGEASVSNVDGDILVDVHAARVMTTRTRGILRLDTGSGSVEVTDADGDVELDTGSGDVTVTRVTGSSLQLDTGSGRVTATAVDVRELRLDTGSGRMSLRDVRSPDIMLDSGSGSVELLLAADVESVLVDAGSGSVTIGVPESLGAMVSAETGSGGIDFDFPVSVTRSGRNYFTGQLGDGRGRITIDSGSGSIRFRRS